MSSWKKRREINMRRRWKDPCKGQITLNRNEIRFEHIALQSIICVEITDKTAPEEVQENTEDIS
jgi:hypothetical protein